MELSTKTLYKLLGIFFIVLGIAGIVVSIAYTIIGGGHIADTMSGMFYAMAALIIVGVMLFRRAR